MYARMMVRLIVMISAKVSCLWISAPNGDVSIHAINFDGFDG